MKIAIDETYKNSQANTNAYLASISNSLGVLAKAQSGVIQEMDYNAIKSVVAAGNAPLVFPVGTQLVNTYTDKDGKEYDCPWDVVQPNDTAELESGTTAPALIMQMHYATLYDIPFSEYQAFYVVPEGGMAAGVYNVIMGIDWGTYVKKGTTYQFALSKVAPAGARLTGFYQARESAPSNWKVYVYKDQYKSELLETCNVTAGQAGTNLGTFLFNKNGKLNSLFDTSYGNCLWIYSSIRQNLNSDMPAGKWWNPQTEWDMKPAEADAVPGFLAGFSDNFKNMLVSTKVVTYSNKVIGDGSAVVTYDKVFLPSLQELYFQTQVSGEGTYWPYWKERTGAKSPQPLYIKEPLRITYRIDSRASTSKIYLRTQDSADSNAGRVFIIYSTGTTGTWYSDDKCMLAPACKIVGLK